MYKLLIGNIIKIVMHSEVVAQGHDIICNLSRGREAH